MPLRARISTGKVDRTFYPANNNSPESTAAFRGIALFYNDGAEVPMPYLLVRHLVLPVLHYFLLHAKHRFRQPDACRRCFSSLYCNGRIAYLQISVFVQDGIRDISACNIDRFHLDFPPPADHISALLLFYHAFPLSERCRETKSPRRAFLQLSGGLRYTTGHRCSSHRSAMVIRSQ